MPNHRTTPENYITKCREAHGDRYDYSKTEYTTSREYVTITCLTHGDFRQQANTHLSKKSGCPKCNLGVRKTTECFIKDAKAVHGDYYNYNLVDYVRKQDSVRIVCPMHGEFLQRPSDHLAGSKCPSCAKYGFNKNSKSYVYLLEADGLVKVGITNREVSERVWQINNNCKTLGLRFGVLLTFRLDGIVAREIESKFKLWAKGIYTQPDLKFDGYSESFKDVDYKLVISKFFELLKEHGE